MEAPDPNCQHTPHVLSRLLLSLMPTAPRILLFLHGRVTERQASAGRQAGRGGGAPQPTQRPCPFQSIHPCGIMPPAQSVAFTPTSNPLASTTPSQARHPPSHASCPTRNEGGRSPPHQAPHLLLHCCLGLRRLGAVQRLGPDRPAARRPPREKGPPWVGGTNIYGHVCTWGVDVWMGMCAYIYGVGWGCMDAPPPLHLRRSTGMCTTAIHSRPKRTPPKQNKTHAPPRDNKHNHTQTDKGATTDCFKAWASGPSSDRQQDSFTAGLEAAIRRRTGEDRGCAYVYIYVYVWWLFV